MNATTRGTAKFQAIISSVVFFGTIALIAVLIWFKPTNKTREDVRKAQFVELLSVKKYDKPIRINVTGVAVPFREISIAAEVTGAITAKEDHCEAGKFVPKNTLLLSIDKKKYELAYQRAEAEKKEAEAKLNRLNTEKEAAQLNLESAADDLQKESGLREQAEELYKNNAISLTEWTRSQKNYNAAKMAKITQQNRVDTLTNDVAAQLQLVELKKIRVEEADIDRKKAAIRAPTDGVIITDDVELNDFVQIGQKMLVFEDTSKVEIKCDLRSDQLQRILDAESDTPLDQFSLPPLNAVIRYQSGEHTYTWKGKLDGYDGLGLNEATRTAPVRILVDGKNTLSVDGKRKLVRGMYVSVELELPKKQSGLVVMPSDVVRADNYVWVYETGSSSDQSEGKEKGWIAEDDEDLKDQKGNRYQEQLGFLRKRKIRVVSRIDEGSGEMVVAKMVEGEVEPGSLIVKSPIPQLVDNMELRRRIYDKPELNEQPMGAQTNVEDQDQEDLVQPGDNDGQNNASVSTKSKWEVPVQ